MSSLASVPLKLKKPLNTRNWASWKTDLLENLRSTPDLVRKINGTAPDVKPTLRHLGLKDEVETLTVEKALAADTVNSLKEEKKFAEEMARVKSKKATQEESDATLSILENLKTDLRSAVAAEALINGKLKTSEEELSSEVKSLERRRESLRKDTDFLIGALCNPQSFHLITNEVLGFVKRDLDLYEARVAAGDLEWLLQQLMATQARIDQNFNLLERAAIISRMVPKKGELLGTFILRLQEEYRAIGGLGFEVPEPTRVANAVTALRQYYIGCPTVKVFLTGLQFAEGDGSHIAVPESCSRTLEEST